MLPRARSAGFIPLEGGSRNKLHFPKGRLRNWPNVEDVEIVVRPHHAWIVNVLPLESVDETDGGQMDTLIVENLIYRCVSQGIMLKLNNRCENNIVAETIAPPRGYYLAVREGPMTGATIQRKIFYSPTKECTSMNCRPVEERRRRIAGDGAWRDPKTPIPTTTFTTARRTVRWAERC